MYIIIGKGDKETLLKALNAKEDEGLSPRNYEGEKITRCKDCPLVYHKTYQSDPKVPYCSKANKDGRDRYIIKHYWEKNRIAPFCQLKEWKDLPNTENRFDSLIFEENNNASNRKRVRRNKRKAGKTIQSKNNQ